MKKVLFVTNIPSPYRVDFYNELGKYVELTVIFEAEGADGISFNYRQKSKNFKSIFLKRGAIEENKVSFQIIKELTKDDYDFIFLTNYSYRTELVGYLSCIFRKIPFILEVDGGSIPKNEMFLKYNFKKFLLTKPQYYFSPSKTSDDFLVHYGANRENIFRYSFTSLLEKDIVEAVPTEEDRKNLKVRLGLDPNKEIVLFVGRQIAIKGIDTIIKAVKNLKNDVQCLIIGSSPDEKYKQYILELVGDDSNFIFLDFMSSDRLGKYYQASDIFIFPTWGDVWGLVINEAMAAGLPIISSSASVAAVELVRNNYNGYIVEEPKDWKSFQFYIEKILSNPKEKKIISQNSLKTIQQYTIEQMVKEHLNFMEGYSD